MSPVSTANSALSSLVPPPLQRSNDNSPCRTLSVLNPDAQHFQPNVQNTRSKRNPDPSAVFTPSEAELNSLKIELSYARTQIINLEAELEDKRRLMMFTCKRSSCWRQAGVIFLMTNTSLVLLSIILQVASLPPHPVFVRSSKYCLVSRTT